MKVFITVLVLIFSLQSWTKADDIRDFEIEGMSIGDSLLDYFSENQIQKKFKNVTFTTNNKFVIIWIPDLSKKSIYESVQLTLKNNDKKYIIYTIDGNLLYDNNIEECYKKQDEIVKEISTLFPKVNPKKGKIRSHRGDKTGKSTVKNTSFRLDKGIISIGCTDWSEAYTKSKNWKDNLSVSVVSQKYLDVYKLN